MTNQPLAIILGIAMIFMVVLLAWTPGHVARTRTHRSAEAISICGWLSLLLWPLWLVAVIWAHTGEHAPRRRVTPRRANTSSRHLSRGQSDAADALEQME